MQKVALSKELGATTYPGRGIVIGRSKDCLLYTSDAADDGLCV